MVAYTACTLVKEMAEKKTNCKSM